RDVLAGPLALLLRRRGRDDRRRRVGLLLRDGGNGRDGLSVGELDAVFDVRLGVGPGRVLFLRPVLLADVVLGHGFGIVCRDGRGGRRLGAAGLLLALAPVVRDGGGDGLRRARRRRRFGRRRGGDGRCAARRRRRRGWARRH